MKHLRKELWIKTRNPRELVNITAQVRDCISESGIKEGLLLCSAMCATAGIVCINSDETLHRNLENWLENLAPENNHQSQSVLDDNTHAKLKQILTGRDLVIAVNEGELDLGQLEQLYFAEFDGSGRKRVLIKIIGE